MQKAIINEAGCVIVLDADNFADCIEYCTIVQEETPYSRARRIDLWRRVTAGGKRILVLPRAGFWPARDRLEVQVLLPKGRPVSYNYTGNLWPNKIPIVDEMLAIMERCGGVTLQIDPGGGKSKFATSVIARLGVEALYVAKNKALYDQAVASCIEDLGQDFSSKKPKANGVTVVVINSLARNPAKFFGPHIGLVIYDEAREYCSDVYSKVFAACNARYLLGLSADPTRDDGLSKRLFSGVGPVYAPVLSRKKFRLVVKVYRYPNPKPFRKIARNVAGKPSLTLSLEQFNLDEQRTALVVECVREALSRPEANMFAMASRCDLLNTYYDAVKEALGDVGEIAIVTEATTTEERNYAFEHARLIFGTYEILGVGINISRMTDIGFFTTRKARLGQFTGRVLRQDSDVAIERFVYDIVDEGMWFRSHFDERIKIYNEREAEIVECDLPF
jgi:hypothetical protein